MPNEIKKFADEEALLAFLEGCKATFANTSHNHNNAYDVKGSASAALDNAKLYTDTKTSGMITSTERTNLNAAKAHADSAHAPSNAEANQNTFSNVKIGSTTIAADSKTDTLEFVGSNVTITPDATNDKITFAVATGSTSTAGIVKLTNSTSSTSTTTAATPNSVKSAYDLANTAKTNATTAQTRADSAYTLAEGKVDSLSDLGITATATELNYVDGVTSNIQTQLDGKANNSDVPVVYTASQCTTFTSDSGTCTPLAVKKSATMFAVPRVTSTDNAITRFDGTEGEVQNSKIIIEDVTNTRDSSKTAQVIAIPAEGGKKMVYGYCTDQVDGTSFIGGVFDASATSYPYSEGLAIGGTSGNLLWKGAKVATTNDIPTKYAGSSSAGGSATSAVKLDTATAGSATQPVYFSGGKPVATTYTLGASVPSGAVFTDTTYSAATQSAQGLMSATDKKKLDGIASGANAYSLPTASSSTLGGVKTTSTVTSNSGYTACPIISGVPYYKDTNTTYSLSSFGVTATAAELNALDGITATVTELNYMDGVTANVQTQLNGKAESSHTHNYAGSSSSGGAATKVKGTLTNPSSATFYAIPFHSSVSTGDKSLLNNNGLQYQVREGTTSVNGYSVLTLGNSTASGTSGNKFGQIDIYAKTANRGRILQTDISSDIYHYLPTTQGTLLNDKDFTVSNGVLTLNFL